MEIARFFAASERQLLPEFWIKRRGSLHRAPQFTCLWHIRQKVMNRRSYLRENVLEMRVDWRQQRKNLNRQTSALVSEDLRDDERFGIARIALHHVADTHVRERG